MPTYDLIRQEGLRSLLRRAWHRYGYGRDQFVIFVGPLGGSAAEVMPAGIVVRNARENDYAALPSLLAAEERRVRAFLAEDVGWLQIARDGDRLVGYRWMTGRVHGLAAKAVHLASDELYVAHLFVHPEYRRLNVGLALVYAQNEYLAARGFRTYVAAISSDNVPSIRITLRRGGRPVQVLDTRRLFFLHRWTVSSAIPPNVQRLVDEIHR